MAKPKPAPVAPPAPQLNPYIDTDPGHDPDNVLVLDLSNGGRVLIRLMPSWAPGHVERIKTLTKQGFGLWSTAPAPNDNSLPSAHAKSG